MDDPVDLNDGVAEILIDSATGLFEWSDRDDRLDLYQTGLASPLLATVINGFGSAAPWAQDFGRSRTETLFRAFREVSNVWSAFYIQHHDDAYAVVSWIRTLTDQQISDRLLHEFASNPADEGGSSFLGLFVGSPDDMVLFMYSPGAFLRVSLFGRMKTAIPTALQMPPDVL